MRPAALLLLAVVALASGCDGADAARSPEPSEDGETYLYPERALAADLDRYEERIGFLYRKGMLDFLTREERQALGDARIELPLRGSHPLEAFAHSAGGVPTVVLPVLTLKFVEDLCVAYAWRHVNGYALEPIDEYPAMLRHRPPQDFPGGRVPDPLSALGTPPHVWERDARVDELSLRLRNTAWAFVLAHELGHLILGHTGGGPADASHSQQNERRADEFASRLLARSNTLGMGMVVWLQASAGYFQNRADFPSESAYRSWQSGVATHPVNAARLHDLGRSFELAAPAAGEQAALVRAIAREVVRYASLVGDPEQQIVLARCATQASPEELKRLERRACHPGAGRVAANRPL